MDRLTGRDEKMSLIEIRRILERGEWWDNVRDVSPDEPCPWLDELNGAIEAALEKLAAYEDGVEQISERLKKEQENMRYAHDEAAKIEYAGIVYGLRNALLMLGEGKRINAEAALQVRKEAAAHEQRENLPHMRGSRAN